MTPLVGTKVWFGPRRGFNWGWTPVSWEGWTTLVVAMLGILVPLPFLEEAGRVRPAYAVGSTASVIGLLAVTILKGTSPGGFGDGRYEQFRRQRDGR